MKFDTTAHNADYIREEVTEWEGETVAAFLREYLDEFPSSWGDVSIKPEEGTIIEPLFYNPKGRQTDAGRFRQFDRGTFPQFSAAYCEAYVVSAWIVDEWGRKSIHITARPNKNNNK